MKRRLFLAAIAAIPVLPGAARAQVSTFCTNCSTIFQQLQDAAVQAKELATQALQYETQLQQYANMVQNTVALPQMMWSQVQRDISQVRNLANAASLLTGNSGSIMSRLSSASGYATQVGQTPQQISNQFTMWQQTLGNASNSLGRTLGVQQGQMNTYTGIQAHANLQAQSATGQMQAIQAGVEMSSLISTQMNQMQATLTATAQEQAARDMIAADRQAMQDQSFVNFMAPPPPTATGGTSYGPNNLR